MEGLPIWEEALILMIVGILVVFSVLTFFYILILLINKINTFLNKKKADKKLNIGGKDTITSKSDEIDPEIVAVIAAAVLVTLKSRVEIKTIKFLNEPDDTSWARIGRLSLIESHNINVR